MGFFSKKDKENNIKKATQIVNNQTYIEDSNVLIMANDAVNICAEACSCCWDSRLPARYEERSEYISKRTRIGHGSVIEHSNSVFYIEVRDRYLQDIIEFTTKAKYLNVVYHHSSIEGSNMNYLIVGGSWRGYRWLIANMNNFFDNHVVTRLISMLYSTANSCGFKDIIDDGTILDDFDDDDYEFGSIYSADSHSVVSENIEIINADNFNVLLNNITDICPEPDLFTPVELLDMCTVTVLFKNMTRAGTHQLVRHRNGITQESQRYVDYSKGSFSSPDKFVDKYDKNHKYSIQFGTSSQKMTLQEIGDSITGIYNQVYDRDRNGEHALKREDARAFLPTNIQCKKIYITFTWRTLFAFFDLRVDPHAQAEIRMFATDIYNWFINLFPAYKDFKFALDIYRNDDSATDSFWYKSLKHSNNQDSSVEVTYTTEEIENFMNAAVEQDEGE